MKKIMMTALLLFLTSGMGMGVWADGTPVPPGPMTRDQAIQHRGQVRQKHQRKGKPTRKVEGRAAKGAPEVSPSPAVKTGQ